MSSELTCQELVELVTDYFDGAPKTDSLRARIIREPSTAVAEFEVGNVWAPSHPRTRTQRAVGGG